MNLKFAKELKNVFGLFINMNEFIYDEKPDNPNFLSIVPCKNHMIFS